MPNQPDKFSQPGVSMARGKRHFTFSLRLFIIGVIIAVLTQLGAGSIYAQSSPTTVKSNQIAFKAEAFDLADVQLLDSPFKRAMDLNAKYLLSLSPDRFLSLFRKEAGLTPKAPNYGGWESPTTGAGRCLGHYLSALSLQYRATGDPRFKRRIDYIVEELATCQKAYGNGYVGALPDAREVFARLAANDGKALYQSRVPWYVIHKLMAGLRDAHWLAGNAGARTVLIKLSDWAIATTQGLDDTQFQIMLEQEQGGIREVLADVYAMTADPKYLKLADRFAHKQVLEPLASQKDKLAGLHANTQLAKIVGSARMYELTGDEREATISKYFWDMVVHHHTYVIGGNGTDEHFTAQDWLPLTMTTCETCNTYNMLKLTRHLFEWNPNPKYADYYENALYNDILASQDPATGMFTYFMSLLPGHYCIYSNPTNSFWCCVGTGMENHTQYGNSIYFYHDDQLFVNLFIPSILNWQDKGLIIRQETAYPASDKILFKLKATHPTDFILKLRYPSWAKPGLTVKINGQLIEINAQPGSYASIQRTWMNGDEMQVQIPFGLRTEAMPGNPREISILYGPLVLGGQLGEITTSQLRSSHLPTKDDFSDVPVLIDTGKPVDEWVKPVAGKPLTFRTVGVGQPHDVTLVPFYQQAHERYTVYWDQVQPKAANPAK